MATSPQNRSVPFTDTEAEVPGKYADLGGLHVTAVSTGEVYAELHKKGHQCIEFRLSNDTALEYTDAKGNIHNTFIRPELAETIRKAILGAKENDGRLDEKEATGIINLLGRAFREAPKNGTMPLTDPGRDGESSASQYVSGSKPWFANADWEQNRFTDTNATKTVDVSKKGNRMELVFDDSTGGLVQGHLVVDGNKVQLFDATDGLHHNERHLPLSQTGRELAAELRKALSDNTLTQAETDHLGNLAAQTFHTGSAEAKRQK